MNYEGAIYRPPSEAGSFILQVTIGCARNTCTFCTMYKDKTFRMRHMDEIRADIREVYAYYGDRIRRIFLADGDALIMPAERLLEILEELRRYFPSAERITSYGAPKDVLGKTPEELTRLRRAGLSMIYMGLESGDEEVLRHVKKGAAAAEIVEAGQRLKEAGMQTSVTLISGLGGRARLREHAVHSAEAISAMKPDYVGFLTLMVEPGAPMREELERGEMELLTPEEVAEEMELFLTHVDAEGCVFRSNHASNYIMLGGTLNRDIPDMLWKLRQARENGVFRREGWRAL